MKTVIVFLFGVFCVLVAQQFAKPSDTYTFTQQDIREIVWAAYSLGQNQPPDDIGLVRLTITDIEGKI